MLGSMVCYIVAGLSVNVYISLISCVATGFSTFMLWSGSLIFTEKSFKNVPVAFYAMMAVGGDLGASIAPQLLGVIEDKMKTKSFIIELSEIMVLTPEQLSIKSAMLISAIFPLAGLLLMVYMKKNTPYESKN